MKRRIIYKSIFDYGHHKDTITYNEIGHYHLYEGYHHIVFTHDHNKMEIKYNNENVYLYVNDDVLHFNTFKEIKNDYKGMYLNTQIDNLSYNDEAFKFIYELYQNNEKIARVYLFIKINMLGEDYEAS